MKIFGLDIIKTDYKTFFFDITKLDKKTIVSTPNPEIILKSLKDKEFKDILLSSNLLVPDGIGLYIAYQIKDNYRGFIKEFFSLPYYFFNILFRKKYLYQKYGERICGSDLTIDLVKFSEEKNIKIAIIDLYNPKDLFKIHSQKLFEGKLQKQFYNLNFEYFIYDEDKKENIISFIKDSGAKIIFSTQGMKEQEKTILEIMNICDNLKLGIGVGSSFDAILGFQKRAPFIVRKLGFEWFYRLIFGPKKLNRLKRLWNAIFVFTFKSLKNN